MSLSISESYRERAKRDFVKAEKKRYGIRGLIERLIYSKKKDGVQNN